MHTKDYKHFPKSSDYHTGNNRAQAVKCIVDISDCSADCISNRTEHQQSKRNHNRNGKHWCKQISHHNRKYFIKKFLNIRCNPDCQNNRNHRRCIAEKLYRYPQKLNWIPCIYHCNIIRRHKCTCNYNRNKYIHIKFFRRRHCNQYR